MVFPTSQREEYENNPLEEVICQLRFPTILKIRTTAPAEFQDRVRQRFPLYGQQSPTPAVPEQIRGLLSQAGIDDLFASQAPSQHRFTTENMARSISLQPEFIAFTVKDYSRWHDFRQQFELIEREFRCLYRPQFYSRIGLRYRDVITRETLGLGGKHWGDLLNSDIAGILGKKESNELTTQALTVIQMRLVEIAGAELTLRHGLQRQADQDITSYLIDTDIFIKERTEPSDTFKLLDQFNRAAGNIFRWAISDTLRNALGPERI